MARVVVIGAGVGGLCAAARLAAAGHRVTVCEAAGVIGGKLGVLDRGGFRFDTGPSLLTWPEVFEDTFTAAGVRLDEHLELERVTPAFRYRFADGTWITVPNGSPQRVAEAFGDQLGGRAAQDWRAFCTHAELVWHAVRGPFLSEPLNGPVDLLRHSRRLRDLRRIAPWRTLRGTGARFLRDPQLRTLLDRYATYSGSDPRRAPAALAVVPWLEQTHGVWYVRGGLHRLAEALGGCATTAGAVLRLGSRVRQVCVHGGRVAGVRLAGGEQLAADAVVCNADATRLYRELLDGPVARRPLRRLARATPSLSGFVLLLGLRGPGPGRGSGAPHGALPRRLRRRVRQHLRPGPSPAGAGGRPGRLPGRARRPGGAPRRPARGVVRPGQRAPPGPAERGGLGARRARAALRHPRARRPGDAGRGRPRPNRAPGHPHPG